MNTVQNTAISGIWRDYTTQEILVTVNHPWGIIIVALAGIWLSWSTKYIKKILGNLALWIHLPSKPPSNGSTNTSEDPTESTALLDHGTQAPGTKSAQSLAKVFKDKSGIRDLFATSCVGKELTKGDKIRLFVFTTCVSLLVIGLAVGGYFLTKIRVDGPARLSSDKCGLWLFEGEKRSDAATRARMLDLAKEERAAQFAENCYGQSVSNAPSCKVFHQPKLPISRAIYTNDCPFSGDICRLNQTVSFETPYIDAKELGIHDSTTPWFRRSTSCSPLNMSYPYIQNTTHNGTTTFTYHYGSKHGDKGPVNYTYLTVGTPWDRLAPVYDVFAYSSNADDEDDPVWKPHPDLTPPEYSTVTIVFVSSLRILYEEYSDDPIFPANESQSVPGDARLWFRNSDPRARPIACVNTMEVCAPDRTTCWNVNEPTSNISTPDNTTAFVFLYSALYKTDIYYSLAKRQGRALLAQQKVSQYFSSALGENAWAAEVENWFKISLARTTINAWSVASGEDSIHEGKDGFVEQTKAYGDLCGKYIYNPQGYQSLQFWPLVLLAAWLPCIWILSWDWEPIKQNFTKTINGVRAPFRRLFGRLHAHVALRHNSSNGATPTTPGNQPHTEAPQGTNGQNASPPVFRQSPEGEPPLSIPPNPQRSPQPDNEQATNNGEANNGEINTSIINSTSADEHSDTSTEGIIKREPLVIQKVLYLLLVIVIGPFWIIWKCLKAAITCSWTT